MFLRVGLSLDLISGGYGVDHNIWVRSRGFNEGLRPNIRGT